MMNWKQKCLSAMHKEDLFEDAGHRTRFKELLDCYSHYPFFAKGMCKCMYLAALDNELFCMMLETLSDMALSHEKNTDEMRAKASMLAQEHADSEASYIYQLSIAFLDDVPFSLDDTENLSTNILYIIGRALYMSSVIDPL